MQSNITSCNMIIYHWDNLLAEILNSVFYFVIAAHFLQNLSFFTDVHTAEGSLNSGVGVCFMLLRLKLSPFCLKLVFIM